MKFVQNGALEQLTNTVDLRICSVCLRAIDVV